MDSSIFVWNCHGAASLKFRRVLKSLLWGYRPDLVVLVEPRISGMTADKIIKKMGYPFSHRIEARGFAGGIWMIWSDKIKVNVITNHRQFIHCEVRELLTDQVFLFTAIYGSPNPTAREKLWKDLLNLQIRPSGAWLIAGDFNATVEARERKGGARRLQQGCKYFKSFIDEVGLLDLGYVGPKFTWQCGGLLVRLDRVLSNEKWLEKNPSTQVMHLPKVQSDHRPLLIKSTASKPQAQRPFRFLASWLLHPEFSTLVRKHWDTGRRLTECIESFSLEAQQWNTQVFGEIGQTKAT
ncbi:uncharacterized protein LOC114759691 [Neltuma alba]|uniref:uncharacterized protein LOC114759691 n=1 Tax=Neltuma alba TaxID=207710 RepID=UPI0010A528AC|nr:uncharacterized protein LOC114759691 [Prosopis alba]